MTRLIMVIGFFFSVTHVIDGQSNPPSTSQSNSPRYQEVVYLQVNSSFLLVGESVLFNAYCVNSITNMPSDLSKVLNVELINEGAVSVLNAKILMKDGRGYGDFFLPSTLSSGNYTLLAYTNWMRNFPGQSFFRTQVTVINPFKKPSAVTSIQANRPVTTKSKDNSPQISKSGFDFSLERKSFKTREKVKMNLSLNDTVGANLSVSVRKIDRLISSAMDSSSLPGVEPSASSNALPIAYLPEVRGNLLTGWVRKHKKTVPVAGEMVYLSVPSKDYLFLTSVTDSQGRFYFNSNQAKFTTEAVLQIDSASCGDCEITVDEQGLDDYAFSKPTPLLIDSSFRKLIEERSLISQIENAYYSQKQDSLLDRSSASRFYGKADYTYRLDDYVRFPAMEDILIEFISEIVLRKRDGNFEIKVKDARTRETYEKNPLILIDGIPVFDVKTVLHYDPLLVEKVEVVGKRYFYGALEIQGIISISTYDGAGKNIPSLKKEKYRGVQLRKKYFSPDYTVPSTRDRIPDYRLQLYWNPSVFVSVRPRSIEFFTSDLPGDFEVVIFGIGNDGHIIYHRDIIHVGR